MSTAHAYDCLDDLVVRAEGEIDRLSAIVRERVPEFRRPKLRLFGGTTDAGKAMPGEHTLHLNQDLLLAYPEEMLADTLPHELAHLVVFMAWGPGSAPHGRRWQHVMRDWFGVEPRRTHDFDLSGLDVRRQRRWTYHCSCQEHEISTTRHHRVQRGRASYLCRSCGDAIRKGPSAA